MYLVQKKRLRTPRKTSVVTINQIWHELCQSQNKDGVEVSQLGMTLSQKHQKKQNWTKEEWISKLKEACDDGLLTYWTGKKGDIFLGLPQSNVHDHNFGDRDWYCFECHKEGDVVRCGSCSKSFHLECLPVTLKTATFGVMNSPCDDCTMISLNASMENIPGTVKLNEIVALVLKEVCEWKDGVMQSVTNWPRMLFGDHSTNWRTAYLLYAPIDVTVMYNKAVQGGYLCLEEFHKECKLLAHNLAIFFGEPMIEYPSIGEKFLSKVKDEIWQINQCHECFLRCMKQEDEWWFCKPCAIPHEVVWANPPGHPARAMWPAKIMKRIGGMCWVTVFGVAALNWMFIPDIHVLPIATQVNSEGMTDEWKQAVAELRKFQELSVL